MLFRWLILAGGLLLPLPAAAQTGICRMFAQRAFLAADQRDRGLPMAQLDWEIAEAERLGQERIARVFRAMRRDLVADPAISPHAAYRISRLAPCGWPGASPFAPVSR